MENKNHLHWQFLRIWQSLWRFILDSLYVNTFTVQKQMGLLRVWYGELRKGLLLYCCTQVWMKNGGRVPWNASLLSAKHARSLVWWETPHEWRFGEPRSRPVIPFGAMVDHHPISAKDLSRLHQLGPKVLPGMFFGCILYAGENLDRRHFGRRH